MRASEWENKMLQINDIVMHLFVIFTITFF